MSWIHKIWPKRAKAKSKQGLGGALAPAYGQDLQYPDELINRANKRAVRGDIEGAIADFDVAIELNPAKATTFYNRGYLHNLSGNYRQAIADCTDAIALLPEYDEAFYQRGLAQLELGNTEAAIVDLSEVLRLNPFSIKAYYKRASCYAAQNDIQGAVADYTQAILRVPKDSNAYLQRGLFLSKLQEYQTAIEDFSSALSFNPKSADAYYHRGYCYAELGQKEKATQDFNQAMLYDPSQRVADYNRNYALGIIKEAKNLPPAAEYDDVPTILQDNEAVVLSLDTDDPTIITSPPVAQSGPSVSHPSPVDSPDFSVNESAAAPQSMGVLVRQTDVDVLFATGQQKSETGDFEGAIDAYSKILEYEPENARAYLERSKSFAAIGEMEFAAEDMDAAVRCAKQKSLNLMKDYSGTLSETLATLKVDLASQPDGSESSPTTNQSIEAEIMRYSQAIHRNPLDAKAYFKRAQSRALLGDLDGAIADYTRTISLEPEHREAYYKRGMLLEALGDEDGATQDLNRAIRHTALLLPASNHKGQPSQIPHPPISHQPASVNQHSSTTEAPIARDPSPQTPTDPRNDSGPHDSAESPSPSTSMTSPTVEASSDPPAISNLDESSQGEGATAAEQADENHSIHEAATALDTDDFAAAQRNQTLLQHDDNDSEEKDEFAHSVPTYFSDLVLEPCNHEGNDPANRFCVHCGQPIPPITE